MGLFDADLAKSDTIAKQFNDLLAMATKYKEEETALFKSFLDKVDKYQKKLETIAKDSAYRAGQLHSAAKLMAQWEKFYDSVKSLPPDKLEMKAAVVAGPPIHAKLNRMKPLLPQVREAVDGHLADELQRVKNLVKEQEAALAKWQKTAEKHQAAINYCRQIATNAPLPP